MVILSRCFDLNLPQTIFHIDDVNSFLVDCLDNL
jgi:hypothetical protein